MEKTLLIFDFDGTIANTLEVAVDIVNEMSEEFHFPSVTKEEFVHYRGKSIPELMRLSGLSWIQLPALVKRTRDHFKQRIGDVLPVEGMPDILRALASEGYRLGILTSNTQENVEAFLKLYDLELFEFVQAPKSIFGKASRLKYLQKNLRIPHQHMVMIGDEIRDTQAAQKAQIDSVAVTWGFNSEELLQSHSPTCILQQPQELLSLFSVVPTT